MKTAIIIPARYASTRLPGKPLIEINGKPIIQWVYEKAKGANFADMVIVATDDERIFNVVKDFDGEVVMTSSEHQCGSDRIAEVIQKYPSIDIAVNVQGDEPLITPESIDDAIKALKEDSSADISTLIREIKDEEEVLNPNIVKVVFDNNQNAMYFSRSPMPYHRNKGEVKNYAHIGLYAYRADALIKMTKMEQSPLELAESLEQLRALQNGIKIKTCIVDYVPVGIDTKEDVEKFQLIVNSIQ